MESRLLLTIEEVAESLNLSRGTVYPLVMSGLIASVKIGRARRVSAESLAAYVRSLEAEQGAER